MTEREFALALAGFALLGLAHVGAQSLALKAAVGNRCAIGPRDTPAHPSLPAGWLERALRNFPETAPVLLALMPALHAAGGRKPRAAPGILACPPADASGLPWLRPLCWLVATSGLALTLTGVLLP
ncbi:MAG: hypothetical protein ACK4S2_05305 [Gemmobacter sp.]|uniref:hypothetical protein n=1 Tax=Gemmobacter sp. TaxID=1898957 RepID=UPI00391B17A7